MLSIRSPRLCRFATGIGHLLAGLMIVMAGSSYFTYTTAGFDFEAETPNGVEVTYYRLRWNDGATWAGRAVQGIERPPHALDWFDPGGTLFDRPSRTEHPRRWNRFGFWWITQPAADPYVNLRYPGARESYWVAVPSWLVVTLIGAPWLIRARLRRFGSSGPIGETPLK